MSREATTGSDAGSSAGLDWPIAMSDAEIAGVMRAAGCNGLLMDSLALRVARAIEAAAARHALQEASNLCLARANEAREQRQKGAELGARRCASDIRFMLDLAKPNEVRPIATEDRHDG